MNRLHAIPAGVVVACATIAHAQPANDDCATPTPINADGTYNFDLTNATTGAEGQGNQLCASTTGASEITSDVWFCWTATCTGTVTISTCGQTAVDTKIALYLGCNCPTAPVQALCCNDDACDLQSQLVCDVFCGEEYMIQLGTKPGTPPGPGTFRVLCKGDPCDDPTGGEPCEEVPGECCAGSPSHDIPGQPPFNGLSAFVTASVDSNGGNSLVAFDLSGLPAVPTGANHPAPSYAHPTWSGASLGSVFGITLDDQGYLYLTATTSYFFDQLGSLSSGSFGDIFIVDANTGAASVFATLPNTGQGLGNVTYDCAHDQLFVTNHEDGMIYRLDINSGAVLSTFDHGAPDDGASGYAPLGERLWAVQVHNGRVYYGVWVEDSGTFSAATSNEVWSVALDGVGEFMGAAQLELSLPDYQQGYSMPVSDMRFTPTGTLLLAEHGMSDPTSPVPHQSRVLEYECAGGRWTLSPNTYLVGTSNGANTAGGVDIDYATGGRVWATGDALQFNPEVIYGLQGLPYGGGDLTNSHLVDHNNEVLQQDKSKMGDIVLTCPKLCATIDNEIIKCQLDADHGWDGKYTYMFDITNNTNVPVQYVLFPGTTVMPNIVTLDDTLNPGATTTVVVTLCDLQPGVEACFPMVLADATVNECCRIDICVTPPDCSCLQFEGFKVTCDPATGDLTWSLTFTNLTPDMVEHVFLFPPLGSGITITPNYLDVPTIPPFTTATIGPITITGATPGEELCILVSIHDEALNQCCAKEFCFIVPECIQPFSACDLNRDGVVNLFDLLILLGAWGPCNGCAADIVQSGQVDIFDLLSLLSMWG